MSKTFTARDVTEDVHKVWKVLATVHSVSMSDVLEAALLHLWTTKDEVDIPQLAGKAKKFVMGSKIF